MPTTRGKRPAQRNCGCPEVSDVRPSAGARRERQRHGRLDFYAMKGSKTKLLFALLIGAGVLAYRFGDHPALWRLVTRRESIRVLKSAHTPSELTNAVGYLGWFVSLTNGAWIAIRYQDSHSGGVISCAVARDSGGGWFESERHFCGRFSYWPKLKEQVAFEEEMRKSDPKFLGNHASQAEGDGSGFPSYREMMAIESAADLESARRALLKIGFRELAQ